MLKGSCEKKKLYEVSGVTELKKLKITSSCMSSDCWQVWFYCSGVKVQLEWYCAFCRKVPQLWFRSIECLPCHFNLLFSLTKVGYMLQFVGSTKQKATILEDLGLHFHKRAASLCQETGSFFTESSLQKSPPPKEIWVFVLLLAVSELAVAAACLWTSQERRVLKIHQSAK